MQPRVGAIQGQFSISVLTLACSIVVVTLMFCPRFPKGKLAWDGISLGFRLDNIFLLHSKILPEVNV